MEHFDQFTNATFWCYTVLPVVACVLLVHMFFKHLLVVVWFSAKLMIAVVIYSKLRYLITSYIDQVDVFSIESSLLGVPPGSVRVLYLLGYQIAKEQIMLAISTACPSCIPTRATSSPWVDWVNNIVTI
jgi:hypothetical protein